jgi:predicted alpha/beta superfamily hydrolase
MTDAAHAQLRHHDAFASRFLPHARPISVWLPPGYDSETHRRFPVFYLHDGQNLFDPATAFGGNPWRAGETAEWMIRESLIRPLILVGVGNTPDRIKEYGPSRKRPGIADLAKHYGRFLVEELKPFIDREYRTLPEPRDSAIGGSSMGGLISLYLGRWHAETFGMIAAMSPSLWYNREAFLRTSRLHTSWLKNCRIWLDFGTCEGPNPASMQAGLNRTRDLAAAFREASLVDDRDFHYEEIEGGQHNEAAWGGRFDRVLRFLFESSG